MRRVYSILGVAVCVGVAASCSGGDPGDQTSPDDPTGQVFQDQTKCKNTFSNQYLGTQFYCDNATCPCTFGEGDCDHGNACSGTSPSGQALGCNGNGTFFGLTCTPAGGNQCGSSIQVCAPAHCANHKRDFDETQVDCGGVDCGTHCTSSCGSVPADGLAGHCADTCPCPALEGGCTANSNCQVGLVCSLNHGLRFDFPASLGACQASTCTNGTKDGTETAIDCGGGSCPPCSQGFIGANRYGSGGSDIVSDIAVDKSGNVFLVGSFTGTVNFGTGNLVSAGGQDIFVVKLDGSGKAVWANRYGSTGNDGDQSVVVATDATGNVYVGGNFYHTVNFGGGNLATTDAAPDAFLLKLSSTGAFVFAKRYGGTREDRITGIAAEPDGRIIVVGSYSDTINLGGATFTAASNGVANAHDIFVAKLSVTGGHVWSKSFGGSSNDEATDVAVDSAGDATLVGTFATSVNFGTGAQTSKGQGDAYALKLSTSNGATKWVETWGGTIGERATTVAIGANGNPVTGGYFASANVNFGGGAVSSKGQTDMFLVASNKDTGAFVWSKTAGSTATDQAWGLAVDNSTNEVVVTGLMSGSVDFGGGAISVAGGAGFNVFIAEYDATGAFGWASVYGGSAQDRGNGVAIFDTVAAVTGRFGSTVNFGGTSSLSSAGGFDVFLGRYRL